MTPAVQSANTSQRHGIEFEDQMRVSRMFSGTIRVEIDGRGTFDIPAACDLTLHLPTSVKTSGNDWIGLADAARFCAIDRPWRLLYSRWLQCQAAGQQYKSYAEVHELIIPLGAMKRIIGELDEATVLAWHNDVASFVPGPEGAAAARARADEIKEEAAKPGRCGMLRLDFKIDNNGQRRLQFSIQFSRLVELMAELDAKGSYRTGSHVQSHHVIHRDWFHQMKLPIELRSPPRHIDRTVREPEAEACLFGDGAELISAKPTIRQTVTPDAGDESDDGGSDVFATPLPSELRRPTPLRLEERKRMRQAAANTDQTSMFG